MVLTLLTFILGFTVSAFIFWKRLKEDYASEIIFNSLSIIFASLLVSYLLAFKFFPTWFFWFEFAGILIGLLIAVYKNKLKFYETSEALIFALTPVTALLFLNDAVQNSSMFSFIAFVVILFLIFVFYYMDSHYKNFAWYRSGKIGLSGLSILFLFFLIRAAIATFFPSVLSFCGKFEPYLSGLFALITLGVIFNLGSEEK